MKRNTLIAMAAAAGLGLSASASYGVSRDWNVGSGMWNTSGNWSPSGTPGGLDSVFIGNMAAAQNGTVSLNVNTTVASIALTDGMTLDTQGFSIFSGTSTSVSGFNSTGTGNFATTLRIGQGVGTYSFRTDTLTTSLGARVDMNGGGELRVDNTFNLQDTTSLGGFGVVNLMGNGTTAFTVNGDIVPRIGGLTINQLGTGRIDLDGGTADDKVISITQSNAGGQAASLTINGDELLDHMDDSFEIGGRSTLAMNLTNGWTLGPVAHVTFKTNSSGVAGAAKLNGSTATFAGDIIVDQLAHGQINAAAVINNSSVVTMAQNSLLDFEGTTTINGGQWQIDKFARLSFDGPTTVNGGTFNTFDNNALNGDVTFSGTTTYNGTVTFNGNARQVGNAIVNDTAVINADVFNMASGFPSPQWTIKGGLTVNADWIDVVGSNDFDGTIQTLPNNNNGAGSMTINLPAGQSWTMSGALALNGPNNAGFVSAINGSPMQQNGVMLTGGGVAVTARTSFLDGSQTHVNSGTLALDGGTKANPNRMNNANIDGAGALLAQSGHAVVGNGTIAVATINFIGDAELRAANGTLTVNSNIIDMGTIGTADATGVLDLEQSYSNASTAKIELLGGKVVGAGIANQGLTTGFGTITNSFANNKTLSAVGGELVMAGQTDLDGVLGGVPTVNAISGDIRVPSSPTDAFAGIATVGGGRKMHFENGWILESTGTLNVGGSLVQPAVVSGNNLQVMFGRTNVNFGARFDIPTGYLTGATVSLPNASDQLTFTKNAMVNSGAVFSGNGSLRNAPGSQFAMNPGSAVGVHLQNDGELNVAGNANVGTVTLKSLSSGTTAQMTSGIGGAAPGTQFDRVEITQGASLDGKLALTTLNGYNPAYLTKHELVHVDPNGNGISGHFKQITGMQITPTKYWAVTYGPGSVFATAALPGDADLNGVINFDDYSKTDFGFNNQLPGWSNGDFDGNGNINFDDYALIDLSFNTQGGSAMAAARWLLGDDRSLENAAVPGVQTVIEHFKQFGQPYANSFLATAVPEPTSAIGISAMALTMLGRRRRSAK